MSEAPAAPGLLKLAADNGGGEGKGARGPVSFSKRWDFYKSTNNLLLHKCQSYFLNSIEKHPNVIHIKTFVTWVKIAFITRVHHAYSGDLYLVPH